MRVSFKAKVTETDNCKGIWLNTIRVKLRNGEIVTLDRNETEFSINGHDADIEFCNVYSWDSGTDEENYANYNLFAEDFFGAKLLDWEVEDDADDDYKLRIIKKSLHFTFEGRGCDGLYRYDAEKGEELQDRCTGCVHYRFDEDNECMACFALRDYETLGIDFNPKTEKILPDGRISIYNISWDISKGEKVYLPSTVRVNIRELYDSYGINEDSIGNYLADKYGFCVNSYSVLLMGLGYLEF